MSQTHPPKEIIVIDDGSDDQTSNIQKDFPQVIYIYKQNGGVSSARNLGIKHAKSEWIAFLDSDDEWHKAKVAKQVDFHKNNSDILVSYTDELWIRDNKEVKIPKKFKKYGGDVFSKCLNHCIIAPSAVLIHKNIFDKIGVFNEDLEVCEDYDLWLRISSKCPIGLVDEKLITKYAGHDDQLSFKHWGMDRFRTLALEGLLSSIILDPEEEKVEAISNKIKKTKVATKEIQLDYRIQNLVRTELIKKYTLLLKGAIKYEKIEDVKVYEKRIEELKNN